MSLIQDALKRKREEEALTPPPKEAPPAPAVAEPKPPVPTNNPTPDKILIVLILLILVSLTTIGILKFNRARVVEPEATPQVAPVVAPPQPGEPVETVEAPSSVEKIIEKIKGDHWPELKLTGFAAGGGQRMVFINGKMLSVGREIEGVRIVQIGKDNVIVEYQTERRTLRVDDQ